MLLRLFPGKPLEEFDDLDWPRLMRALRVREIERLDEMRDLQQQGKYQPSAAEWRQILYLDELERYV